MNKKIGKLFLIPNTLGDISPNKVMSLTIREVIHSTHHFVFEKDDSSVRRNYYVRRRRARVTHRPGLGTGGV